MITKLEIIVFVVLLKILTVILPYIWMIVFTWAAWYVLAKLFGIFYLPPLKLLYAIFRWLRETIRPRKKGGKDK